ASPRPSASQVPYGRWSFLPGRPSVRFVSLPEAPSPTFRLWLESQVSADGDLLLHGGLELGARRELDALRRGDLHDLTGTRLAALSRGTLRLRPRPETGQRPFVAAGNRILHGIDHCVQRTLRLTLGDPRTVRDCVDELGLVHAPSQDRALSKIS